ncbi:MAG: hypothetical protein ACREA4_04015 [Nitrososphaera sp.]
MSSKKRDDSYFAAGRRRKKKYMMIIIPIVAAIAAAGVAAAVLAPRDASSNFGPLGSAHEHAIFEVRLNGDAVDFSQSKYQVRSQFIHVENNDGTTLHRHATNVTVGEFLKSVRMNIQDNCFVADDGRRFCEDGTNQLRYFVNGTVKSSIMDYVLADNDRILVIYGSESQEQLQAAFERLNEIGLRK